MKRLASVYFLLASTAIAQQSTGPATTKGLCSPANTGNQNIFTITCGIGKEQGEAMLRILNKILMNQLDSDAVMKKLDEILHTVNPNLPAKTYFCDGRWRTLGPSATAALNIEMGGDDTAFKEMARLNNTGQYQALLKLCVAQIQSAPEWLTPRLFCALAYLRIGDKEKAKGMLAEFDSKTGPAYDADSCKQASDFLHTQLR